MPLVGLAPLVSRWEWTRASPRSQGAIAFGHASSTVALVTMTATPARPVIVESVSSRTTAANHNLASPRTVVSLFSGIAGLDGGMEHAGFRVVEMCESWEPARRVLHDRFPHIRVAGDVVQYTPEVDYTVLAAGFPCTDLSHVGSREGIFGPKSGLVEHVFRVAATTQPEWILLENVPNLLTLHTGAAIAEVVDQLEALGYRWAYRTVDSRFTGVPQRRYRVILLASRGHDPASRLLGEDAHPVPSSEAKADTASDPVPGSGDRPNRPHGFYWTEGRNGLGLVEGAIPTLKGGSTLGLPSAPAVWFPTAPLGRRFVLPTVEDGEALQGLPRGWTRAAVVPGERDLRWKLLGNAVTHGVGAWIGDRLATPESALGDARYPLGRQLVRHTRWPKAATGGPGQAAVEVLVSDHPRTLPTISLEEIVDVTTAPPLSHRATRGFLSRVDERARRFDPRLYADLESHLAQTRPKAQPLPPTLPEGSWATSARTRSRMQAQRQRDTKPELRMRQELTALGLRYQLQRRPENDLRSRMDILFKGAKVAVDIRGCFWHSCPEHGSKPKPNAERWAQKLRRNRERDEQSVAALEARGWIVCVVWEHDDPVAKAREVAAIVEARRPPPRAAAPRGRKEDDE